MPNKGWYSFHGLIKVEQIAAGAHLDRLGDGITLVLCHS